MSFSITSYSVVLSSLFPYGVQGASCVPENDNKGVHPHRAVFNQSSIYILIMWLFNMLVVSVFQ